MSSKDTAPYQPTHSLFQDQQPPCWPSLEWINCPQQVDQLAISSHSSSPPQQGQRFPGTQGTGGRHEI